MTMSTSQPAALLFTDVVDSTLTTQRLGDERARQTWAEHDRHARELLRRHHGREIDRADGFFLLFADPAEAARYALDYHIATHSLGLAARVGLHVGPVTLRETSDDDVALGAKRMEVDGLAKPLAARVMAMAGGGQTLLTATARAAVAGVLDAALQVECRGHYQLKGIDEPVEIFELSARDGASFEPPHDTDKTYRVVRAEDGSWRPLRQVPHNLPAERDAFVGRADDLRAIARSFDGGSRLVTLLGPGGTGKTRLVLRYARARLGDWSGGVWFCDLSDARSLDGVFFAVARALDVRLGADDPALQLGRAIAGRGHCLVVLDNFEQVAEHAAATLGRWLDMAAEAVFAVTSRERLHLAGEEVHQVEPLPLENDAIELFALRARARRPDFRLDGASRDSVAEVVRLLDGLPLAIELAAARVGVLSPAQLAARMRDRFRLLAGARGTSARQATLRAAIDWSWQLLTPWEQEALAQCSVFEGGFTLPAAEGVLDLSAWPDAPPVVDAVQALVDKSLLRRWIPAGAFSRHALDEPYFGMYISIHEYAREKCRLHGATSEGAAQQRHGSYFAGFGDDAAIEAMSMHGGERRHRALELELDNLVAACRRAVTRGDGETAVATYRAAWEVLSYQGPFGLGVSLGAEVGATAGITELQRELARLSHSEALARVGQTQGLEALFQQALVGVRAIGDRKLEARILGKLGTVALWDGRLDECRAHYTAALQIFRELGNRLYEGRMSGNLAISYHEQGRTDEARQCYEAALVIWRDLGSLRDEGISLSNLADLLGEQGQREEARAAFDRALAIMRELGDRDSEAITLDALGVLQSGSDATDDAIETFRASLRLTRELGNQRVETHVLENLGGALLEKGAFDEARLMFDQVLAMLRSAPNRRLEAHALAGLGDLHFRQGQIADAVARLAQAESMLREQSDRPTLARVLCVRGLVDLANADAAAAGAALAEAEAAAAAMSVGPDSEIGRLLAKLRLALDGNG
jgi:predicted ATPase/class 3 adenylate cyclase/Tfp pilus assembly protein PilF